jgi:hypothetical protein
MAEEPHSLGSWATEGSTEAEWRSWEVEGGYEARGSAGCIAGQPAPWKKVAHGSR